MSRITINEQKIKKGLRIFFWFVGVRAFSSFMILTFITLFVAALFSYYYVYLPLNTEPVVEVKQPDINSDLYKEFVKNYTQRKEKFYNPDFLNFEDPFYKD